MYVAVKGGERAIENAHRLLAHERRGDRDVPEISLLQLSEQLSLGVDRVMTEGSLYDRELAALAIKQARGDLIEAIFLVRAHRTSLPRFGTAVPIDTADMDIRRRISATIIDIENGFSRTATCGSPVTVSSTTSRSLVVTMSGTACGPRSRRATWATGASGSPFSMTIT